MTCQTRTALVKFSLRNLIVYFLLCQLAHLGVLRDFWTVSRRGPADWRFTGDPAPLARDNMYLMSHLVDFRHIRLGVQVFFLTFVLFWTVVTT